jgi:hypothetical protein
MEKRRVDKLASWLMVGTFLEALRRQVLLLADLAKFNTCSKIFRGLSGLYSAFKKI